MGLSCDKICPGPKLDPEVENILKTVGEKSPDIINNCVIQKQLIEKEKEELLNERDKKVGEAKEQGMQQDQLKELLKTYNKKELDIEKKLISNEVDKMHSLWELGLDLSKPLKDYTLKELNKKLDKAKDPLRKVIESQINDVKAYSPKQFLNSPFGKPLKSALIKQGMSKNLLTDFKKDLLKQRKERRKNERPKYKDFVKVNEFPPEDEFEFNVDDLYEAIFEEYKDDFKSTIEKNLLKL